MTVAPTVLDTTGSTMIGWCSIDNHDQKKQCNLVITLHTHTPPPFHNMGFASSELPENYGQAIAELIAELIQAYQSKVSVNMMLLKKKISKKYRLPSMPKVS